MRGLTCESVLNGPERVAAGLPPAHAEAAADMGEEVNVDIVEDTLTHEERLGGDLLLRNARPEQELSVDIFSLHDLFHGEGPHDIHGLTRVVAFAVPRSHSKDRIAIRHAGLLI